MSSFSETADAEVTASVTCASVCMCAVNETARLCHSLTEMQNMLGVDRLSAPILSILPIIDIGHFKNRFADNIYIFFFFMQTNILFTGDIIYW